MTDSDGNGDGGAMSGIKAFVDALKGVVVTTTLDGPELLCKSNSGISIS
jgi:hypothetical protein